MGILEVLTGPQEPQRAVEHVRRHAGHVSVFKRFMAHLSVGMSGLRQQTKGELQIEGWFFTTLEPDIVELKLRAFHQTPKGRITHACDLQFYLQLDSQGRIVAILSSTTLPPEERQS